MSIKNLLEKIKGVFNRRKDDKITYIPYAVDKGWLIHAKSMVEDKESKYLKYEYEIILEDLMSYKEEMKTNENLKMVVIETLGDINIFIEKVKERIDKI